MNKLMFRDITSEKRDNLFELSKLVSEYNESTKLNGAYPILSSTQRGIFLQDEYFDKQTASSDTTGYKIVPRGYFTYRSMSDTGYFTFNIQNIVDKGIVSPAYPVFFASKISTKFLYYYLNNSPSFITQILSSKEGGTRYALSFSKFQKLRINVPSSQEQEKIGGFLSSFDKLIQKQQEKISLLKELKKGYLQQMFPEKGSKIPKIRFNGFADAWEQRSIGQLSKLVTKGTTPIDKSGDGSINFVKVENIDSFSGEISNLSKISIEEHNGYLKRSQLEENDILFSIAGTLGRITSVNKAILPANTNQALAIIRLNEGKLNFLKTALKGKAVEDYIRKNPTIGAQPNLSLEQVKSILVDYPSVEEQSQIGNHFDKLEKLITLHQCKQEILEDLKKGYMQRLFS